MITVTIDTSNLTRKLADFPEALARAQRNALKVIGAPINAADLGLSADDILDALVEARNIRKDRFTILGDNGLSREAAEAVAKATMVI